MNGRERVLMALAHREPDHVPLDIGGSDCSGITKRAYGGLARYLGFPEEAPICERLQQLVTPSEEMLGRLRVDVRTVYPKPPSTFGFVLQDTGRYRAFTDEWGVEWAMPKENGLYYDMIGHPLEDVDDVAEVEAHSWPHGGDRGRIQGLRDEIKDLAERSDAVICLQPMYGGIFEAAGWLRGYDKFYLDLVWNPDLVDAMMDHTLRVRLEYWDLILSEVGDLVDVVCECDDLAGQTNLLISPAMYRQYVKPRHRQLFSFIGERTQAPLWFHSCGAIYDLIPDLLETGINILNPVQVNAANMGDTARLKREFGDALVFWGGGVDTQRVLPTGSPQEVSDEVRRRMDDLAPGGGFVFAAVHNIQADVPPENVMAMWEAWDRYGAY